MTFKLFCMFSLAVIIGKIIASFENYFASCFQGVTLGAGLIITLVSFVLVYFINKKADLIFTPTDPLSSDLDG